MVVVFRVEFNIDNLAFQSGTGREEVSRILKEIQQDIKSGFNHNRIMDINGNTIGSWEAIT